jgi:hypothetical protein
MCCNQHKEFEVRNRVYSYKAAGDKMLRTSRFPLFCSSVLLFCFAVAPAKASTIIYSAFGDDNTNDHNTASGDFLNVSGAAGGYSEIAGAFTPFADYNATSVDLLLGFAGSPFTSDQVDVAIYSDFSDAPGTALDGTTQITVPASMGDPAVYTAFIPSTALVEGTQYWLVVSPARSGTGVAWFYNSASCGCALDSTNTTSRPGIPGWDDSADESQLYFDVNGIETGSGLGSGIAPGNILSLTPEPGTLALLGLGLGAIVLERRRRVSP